MWQPTASITDLKARAQFMARIRQFFTQKDVWEVETPILSHNTVTDLHLDAFSTEFDYDASGVTQSLYLQTSPEFAMKRLLAAGSGAIYQITKAFRHESAGRFHNPEFTMLEWYRPGYNDKDLMAELDELIQCSLNTAPAVYMSYQQAFIEYLAIDPLTIELDPLKLIVAKHSDDLWLQQETQLDTLLQWLFSMKIEPKLGDIDGLWRPCFIYDFPASQASLAKTNQQDPRVAHRFELYFKGVELANGFYELQDAKEQKARFELDNQLRVSAGLPSKPIDEQLLAALEHGLPDCAGVAVGLDRLFMLKHDLSHIEQAIAFTTAKA